MSNVESLPYWSSHPLSVGLMAGHYRYSLGPRVPQDSRRKTLKDSHLSCPIPHLCTWISGTGKLPGEEALGKGSMVATSHCSEEELKRSDYILRSIPWASKTAQQVSPWYQVWYPEFNPWDSQGGRRERTLASCPLTSPTPSLRELLHTHTHIR